MRTIDTLEDTPDECEAQLDEEAADWMDWIERAHFTTESE